MKPKLYLATKTITAMFLSYEDKNLNKDAANYIECENNNIDTNRMVVKEITSKKDVPKEWYDANLWGTDEEINPLSFLEDPEYIEYLRLKKKFEE